MDAKHDDTDPPRADRTPAESASPTDTRNAQPQSRGKKRKQGPGPKFQQGSRKRKGRDLGRNEYLSSRTQPDKRSRNEEQQAKRQKREDGGEHDTSVLPSAFSKEEIGAEERRPKKKVAVLIGYSGTGYRGMQISHTEKTIEGDLFTAFVKAGVISKANADDPKKSTLVRCARTDKGVHAAGNVISLKLIIDEPDIVEKINRELSSQIRVWSVQRTTGSFSCYQACDSRWYEYLIPTHCFLPPHPSSFLAKKLAKLADEVGDREAYDQRQEEVANFWTEAEKDYIKPVVDNMDKGIRTFVMKALYDSGENPEAPLDVEDVETTPGVQEVMVSNEDAQDDATEVAAAKHNDVPEEGLGVETIAESEKGEDVPKPAESKQHKQALEDAIKTLKLAYITAKETYRISPARVARVREALQTYVGTRNHHNFTVRKSFKDPSAQRHIKSFEVADEPTLINGTEWLSLKVHGQSFMMHQIRKMVGMAALVVRCGCPISRIDEAFGPTELAIPKAPGLGLLLERPVFENYNARAAEQFGRSKIDFGDFEKEIQEFKQREIYERIFREEAQSHTFHTFFAHLDNYKQRTFLYLTSKGLEAAPDMRIVKENSRAKGAKAALKLAGTDSEDETEVDPTEAGWDQETLVDPIEVVVDDDKPEGNSAEG